MNKSLVLFEDEGFVNLLPLLFWRSVFELLVGRKTILDRTAQRLELPVTGVWTRDWIAPVASQRCGAPVNQPAMGGTVLANGRWIFNDDVSLKRGPRVGVIENEIAYVVCDAKLADTLRAKDMLDPDRRSAALRDVPREDAPGVMIHYVWDVIGSLASLLGHDWRASDAIIESTLDDRMHVDGRDRLHVGEQSRIHPTTVLDATSGPIYISHDVTIGAYSVIEGPTYIGPGSHVRPHSWLHGPNAIGPVCRVGGEIDGTIMSAYTNKQHAGFLGHAYVGSWVNIGAGASNSDLKNTYGKIRVLLNGDTIDTGLQFMGAIIGDHAKICINGSIATGAVLGLAASVASTGLAPKYLPSFSWVTEDGTRRGDPMRLLDSACAAMARRNVDMTDDEVELMIDLATRVQEYEGRAK